jgi:hypothetical protein
MGSSQNNPEEHVVTACGSLPLAAIVWISR